MSTQKTALNQRNQEFISNLQELLVLLDSGISVANAEGQPGIARAWAVVRTDIQKLIGFLSVFGSVL